MDPAMKKHIVNNNLAIVGKQISIEDNIIRMRNPEGGVSNVATELKDQVGPLHAY
ncbi:hypothetical protein GGI26_006464 [Coemansia sp. RSA 1358]|uniref:Uncharacterized protein n=1 Tax=Coemansia umbellata TaxID=1424467 RepID=A0ABQ8PDJ6_9FUNG|nr:hypothetical protein EDC05_006301 [Coemansia umbellata]KAJ2618617.1 hypothetical protein GGI26_006464 [Coemansia sp. RSA 1358]